MCLLLLNFCRWSHSVCTHFSVHPLLTSSCSSGLPLLCSTPSAHYPSFPHPLLLADIRVDAQSWSIPTNTVNLSGHVHNGLQGPGLALPPSTSGWKINSRAERTVSHTPVPAPQTTSYFWLSISFPVCKMVERVDLFISKRPSSTQKCF